MVETTLWGIHAGRTGDADKLFLKKGFVGLGWNRVNIVLDTLPPSREAFKSAVSEAYPGMKAGAVPVSAGQLFRFVHEMKIGDLVIYPSKRDKRVHIGSVTGDYEYNPSREEGYPHQRSATWSGSFPRTRFSQGALYEIGSAMSLFQVKNYADDFLTVLDKRTVTPQVGEDETVAIIAEDIEQATRDFVVKKLLREMKGHPFAEFVGHLLEKMGYHTRISAPGPDRGIDIIAHRDELGVEPPIIKVQVKSGEGNVGDPTVSALYGKVGPNEHGLLVTLGNFTNQAKNFADGKTNLLLVDGDALVDLILAHYDELDSKYKGVLPLRRVFVPEPLIESEE